MTRLHDSISVERSAEEAEAALSRFFASLRGRDGIARLRLHALDREVCVEARPALDEAGANDVTYIEWSPQGPTVLPRFSGSLVICPQRQPGRSHVELDGTYAPPHGAEGQTFDAAIGHRIAQATARELLADIKAAIELRS